MLKSEFVHGKNNFATIVNGLLVLKMFELSNSRLFFLACLQNLQTLCVVGYFIIPKLKQDVRT